MKPHPLPALCCAALLATAGPALASGTYPGTGVRPPLGGPVVAPLYNLGKAIFLGTAPLTPPPAPPPDAPARLAKLQAALPASVARTTQLPPLAGRLNAEQLDALAYYIAVRFNVKLS